MTATTNAHEWYVCTNYGQTWMGRTEEMDGDYNYPSSSTSYFASEEEAQAEYNFRLEADSFLEWDLPEVQMRGEVFIPRPNGWVVPATVWTAWLSSPETVNVVAIRRGQTVDERFHVMMSRDIFMSLSNA